MIGFAFTQNFLECRRFGFEFEFNWGPVKVSFGSSDVKAVYNWYVNTYVPAAMDCGGKVYDYLH